MRRWIAALFLTITVFYLGASRIDRCTDRVADDCAPVCHILCADGCAVAPLPVAPTPPPPDPLPRAPHEHEQASALVSLEIEPEKDPPKA
jgi:hypothetical protein